MNQDCALLLTDLVDSTSVSAAVGDVAMSRVWQAHDRAARHLLRDWRGREIDKSDGFLLLFDDAADAIGYAIAYHRCLAALEVPLQARAGLHVGPVTLRQNDSEDVALGAKPVEVDGLAKAVAARAMSVAQPGQTLLTATASAAAVDTQWRRQSHGHWRLKGLEHPIELIEVGDAEAPFTPPGDTEKAYRVVQRDDLWLPLREVRHNLPPERDAFVGRRYALRDLVQRFDSGSRLVSVLGIGGSGKTRLAQRFGWTWLGEFPGGVWFCDLAQARSLDGIGHGVAQGMSLALGKADPMTQLGDAIAGRGRCLLILDNFEQVVGFAEQTVGRWLDRAPEARFLVTSREVLGIRGEDAAQLDPLDAHEAASLFLCRAGAAPGEFKPDGVDQAAVTLLVKLLDGLPLAIELAAARVSVMPPRMLLQRMSERFAVLISKGGRTDRQATLHAAFDWSWELLSTPEKSALAQLSVFHGGFRLEAAEAIVDLARHAGAPRIVDTLQSLVEKSLVRRTSQGRFSLLVSLQEYAAEQLQGEATFDGSGANAVTAVRRRHWEYFARLDKNSVLADSCAELDNLVVACRRAAQAADAEAAVGALEAAWEALCLRGPFRAGVELAEFAASASVGQPRLCARVDHVRGWALRDLGRVVEASVHFEAALAAAREVGDRTTERLALNHLGELHMHAGRVDAARRELDAALAMSREGKDRADECAVLIALGNLSENMGSMHEARVYYESALDAARAAGDRRLEGGCLGNLGLLHANQGRMAQAHTCYEAAITIAREVGDRLWEGNTLCNLGLLHQMQGRLAEAKSALEAALLLSRETGYARLGAVVMCNLGIVLEAMQQPEPARLRYEEALTVAREVADRRSQGQFLNYLGVLHARQGRFTQAWACLDEGERLLAEVQDKLNLGLLLCSRAEVGHMSGRADTLATLERARLLAVQVGAEPESELAVALHRVGALVARAAG